MCCFDHRLTWAEFQELTLAQLEALEDRRAASLRQQRYNAALVAAAILNVNRVEGVDYISPFDFLPGYEVDPEELEREKARKAIVNGVRVAIMGIARRPMDEVQAEKQKIIERLRASGHEDAEEIFREAWPDL